MIESEEATSMENQEPAGELPRLTQIDPREVRPGPIRREAIEPLLALWACWLFQRVTLPGLSGILLLPIAALALGADEKWS
jgi:hypothetical protein